jgi:hypothetical protein
MAKLKQWLWIAALALALTAPAAWADEPGGAANFFDDLVAQIVAVVTGTPTVDDGAATQGHPGDQPEIGEIVPVGG